MGKLFKRLDHVGIVVGDLDAALQTYVSLLGLKLLQREHYDEQGVELAFLEVGEGQEGPGGDIEFLHPTDPASGVARFLDRRGDGLHHICFEVDDIETALVELKAQGAQLIDEEPRQGVHGRIAFLHPKGAHGVLIELLERN